MFYTRQQELDVLLVELDRHLNNLTTQYETFENIQKDNRRELEIKFDKHQVKTSVVFLNPNLFYPNFV